MTVSYENNEPTTAKRLIVPLGERQLCYRVEFLSEPLVRIRIDFPLRHVEEHYRFLFLVEEVDLTDAAVMLVDKTEVFVLAARRHSLSPWVLYAWSSLGSGKRAIESFMIDSRSPPWRHRLQYPRVNLPHYDCFTA